MKPKWWVKYRSWFTMFMERVGLIRLAVYSGFYRNDENDPGCHYRRSRYFLRWTRRLPKGYRWF